MFESDLSLGTRSVAACFSGFRQGPTKSPRLSLACLLALLLSTACQISEAVSTDGTFYENSPAPAPGSCPHGSSNATLDLEVTEGPYYVEEDLFRSNITESELGVPFHVRITVLDTDCNPVAGALVDIWHCNATGVYSSYTTVSTGANGNLAPTTMGRRMLAEATTDNTTFLRGTVETDVNGVATFDTIMPGWYSGRVTHVHTKVHIVEETDASLQAEYAESYVAHTGQFFFEEEFLDEVYALSPYSTHTNVQRTKLEDDMVFVSSGNDAQLLFEINEVQPGNLSAGLVGSVTAVVNPLANHTDSGMGAMGGGGMGMGPSGMGGMPSGMGGGMQGGMGFPGLAGIPTAGTIMPQQMPGALPTLAGRKLAGFS